LFSGNFALLDLLRPDNGTNMEIGEKDIEALKALVSQLRNSSPPDCWQVYITLRAVIQDLLADLSTAESASATYPEGQLKGLLLHCRQAAFASAGTNRDSDLQEAEVCITKIQSVQ
jgi:hypothetical protein